MKPSLSSEVQFHKHSARAADGGCQGGPAHELEARMVNPLMRKAAEHAGEIYCRPGLEPPARQEVVRDFQVHKSLNTGAQKLVHHANMPICCSAGDIRALLFESKVRTRPSWRGWCNCFGRDLCGTQHRLPL